MGTVDHTPVYPREVIRRALELSATALILVHNHPSGDPAPSAADVRMTKEIADAPKPIGIIVPRPHHHRPGRTRFIAGTQAVLVFCPAVLLRRPWRRHAPSADRRSAAECAERT